MRENKEPVPGCKDTYVSELMSTDGMQVLFVEVEPGGEIPLHAHECAATMVVVDGQARALGSNERIVRKGDVIVKAPREPHGFSGISARFAFVSISDGHGIKQKGAWDMEYAPLGEK